jgi:predicted transposase/invertase (TIGR01784 family)
MSIVRKKLGTLTNEFDDVLFYNREELLNIGAFNKGKDEGVKLGKEEGIKKNKIDVVKKMLKEKMPDEVIIRIVNISEKELLTIKNKMKTSKN